MRLVKTLGNALSPGSHVVISHLTVDGPDPAAVSHAADVYRGASAPMVFRPGSAIRRLFDGFDLLAPGLVRPCDWYPDPQARERTGWLYAGVGRKPGQLA